ncbi:MAG TPA: HAD family hydrolase [Gemmatimonadales bacterium]|nr:HAD family hydrolase [Gemmatimonadales bacterium]
MARGIPRRAARPATAGKRSADHRARRRQSHAAGRAHDFPRADRHRRRRAEGRALMGGAGGHPAVFLDRDGTIIEDTGFLREPGKVKLLPGAADAIKRLNEHGYLAVVVTNQSGIARGLYSTADYTAVQRRVGELLATHGARLDGTYFCPHHPQFTGPCECRKPGIRLFDDARRALAIDFNRSWWVGDRLADIQPARQLGGHAILVATGEGNLHQGQARALGVMVVADLGKAVDEILRR